MKVIIVPFLLILAHAYEDRIDITCNSNPDDLYYDIQCLHDPIKENIGCSDDYLRIKWDYGDKTKGEIYFTILGRLCSVRDYEVILSRYNSSVENNIDTPKEVLLKKGVNKEDNVIYHSKRIIIERDSNYEPRLPSCNEIKNVTFKYVFSGCYKITVCDFYQDSCTHFSDPICFNTDFIEESMYKQNVSLFSQYVEDLTKVQHVLSNFSRLQVNSMVLEVWRKNSTYRHCDKSTEKISEQEIVVKPSGAACFSKSNTAMPCRLLQEKENGINEHKIECTTYNVTDGYYCFLVKLQHDPCLQSYYPTVWKERQVDCYFSGMIENGNVVHKKEQEDKISSSDSRFTMIMVFLLLLCAIFILALSFILYRKWSHQIARNDDSKKVGSSVVIHVEIETQPVLPQIYLLYSRDCQPFMDVMKIFRSLLKKILNCEVYDCFDPDCFEDLARIGTEWPGKLITKDNVKIVLIETACARLQLEGHFEDFKIFYQNPTHLDDYFMYGLKTILNNPKYNSYHKLFIARVEGFTSEEDKLKEITPYTRYDIPDAFYRLLSSISQQFNITVPDDWNHNTQDLQQAIKILEQFKKDNANYLDTFLVKREVHGIKKFISRLKNH